MAHLLEVDRLSYEYHRGFPIFTDVSFDLEQGEVLTLLGPNGAGKSTLLNCIANLTTPTDGSVRLEGRNLTEFEPRTFAQHVAYVPQQISVTYGYSVREYLVMGAAPHLGMFSTPTARDYEQVEKAIEALGLQPLANRTVSNLSGGERQRVAIARAIVQNPELILFDEPTSALDYGNQIRVLRTIKQLAREGYAIIMTTHNPDHPILLGGKVAMLDRRGSLDVGDSKLTLSGETLSKLYGIDLHLAYVEEVNRFTCISGNLEEGGEPPDGLIER